MAVVVGCIDSFHRTTGIDSGKGGWSFKCKGFVLTVIAVCESSLIIGNCQIICLKNTLYILEKIFFPIVLKISIQAGAVIKIFVCTKGAVSNYTDSKGNWCVVGGF